MRKHGYYMIGGRMVRTPWGAKQKKLNRKRNKAARAARKRNR